MMKKGNYLLIACIVVSIGALLWLESNRKLAAPEREPETVSVTPESSEAASVQEDHSLRVPDSWKEEIDTYNRIDATITVPESIRTDGFKSASAEQISVNREGVLSLLEDYYHPQIGTEDEQVIQYLGEDNMYLNFSPSGDDVSLWSDLAGYISMAYREEATEYYNRDLYLVDQDLDDFTISKCDERIYELCKVVGMEGDIDIVHRALDYKTMEEEAVELHMDGTDSKPDYQWTSDDNSYYCTFSQTCNDILIIPNHYLQAYGDVLNASAHKCVLNEERWIAFNLRKIYDIQYQENYEKLMEFDDILAKYREYMSIASHDYETVVTDITMRAIAVSQGDDSCQVVPMWIFYGYWSSKDGISSTHAIFINAITGERL